MSALYDAAFAAYRALCELEDELDRLDGAKADGLTERERNELYCLKARWTDDTSRKLTRAFRRDTKPRRAAA